MFATVRRHIQTQPLNLGPLEKEVMNVLWNSEPGNVREVASRMGRRLAYTTVMTTLNRLFAKGFLHRYMDGRAFNYSVRLTREEWSRSRARELVEDLLAGPPDSRGLVLSGLIDAVATHEETLLDELKAKIEQKKEELVERKSIGDAIEREPDSQHPQ
jgi:predicted transcriptional regulator